MSILSLSNRLLRLVNLDVVNPDPEEETHKVGRGPDVRLDVNIVKAGDRLAEKRLRRVEQVGQYHARRDRGCYHRAAGHRPRPQALEPVKSSKEDEENRRDNGKLVVVGEIPDPADALLRVRQSCWNKVVDKKELFKVGQ